MQVEAFLRSGSRWGVRNHHLALPVVGCSTVVLDELGDLPVVRGRHQYGCGHVGTDVGMIGDGLWALAAHPNVASVVAVGLGCETIDGPGLVRRLQDAERRAHYVGIQKSGGTANAAREVREILTAELAASDGLQRQPAPSTQFTVGVISSVESRTPGILEDALTEVGFDPRVILGEPDKHGRVAHVPLQAAAVEAGCQAAISLHRRLEPPSGTAVMPVLSIAEDEETYLAFESDLDGVSTSPGFVEWAVSALRDTLSGTLTAVERAVESDVFLRHELRQL